MVATKTFQALQSNGLHVMRNEYDQDWNSEIKEGLKSCLIPFGIACILFAHWFWLVDGSDWQTGLKMVKYDEPTERYVLIEPGDFQYEVLYNRDFRFSYFYLPIMGVGILSFILSFHFAIFR